MIALHYVLIGLALAVGVACAVLGVWLTVAAMVLVVLSQVVALRRRQRGGAGH